MAPQDSVWRWLREIDVPSDPAISPPYPASPTPSVPPQRKRRILDRPAHPAKRLRKDDFDSDKSASAAFDRRSRQQRSTASRNRDRLQDLRVAKPAVLCELPWTIPLPDNAASCCASLTDHLHQRVIPGGLKDRIATAFPLIAKTIPDHAYDDADTRSDRELDQLWELVIEILEQARDASRYQQDYNAWSHKVVYPTLQLALRGTMLEAESVQSQSINSELLPTMPKEEPTQQMCSYTFAFHRHSNEVAQTYQALGQAGRGDLLSPTTDPNTKRLILFAGVGVLEENGGKDDALAQLASWLAASMENTRRLGNWSASTPRSYCDLLPLIGWTVVGHDWYTYIAFGSDQDQLHILGPWRSAAADTRDLYGFFRLVKLLQRASSYATSRYWPWLRQEILNGLRTSTRDVVHRLDNGPSSES